MDLYNNDNTSCKDLYLNDLIFLSLSGLHISDLFKILRLVRVGDGETGEGPVPRAEHDLGSVIGGGQASQLSLDNVFSQLAGVSQSEEENALQPRVVVNNVLVSLAG